MEKGASSPPLHKRIPYSFVFDVKFDLRRKARIVAVGHRTEPPGECYSGVVPIDGVRLPLFLLVLNSACEARCGTAFLHGRTHEKYYFIAGPQFGDWKGEFYFLTNPGMVSRLQLQGGMNSCLKP